jgi:hypothetical protein
MPALALHPRLPIKCLHHDSDTARMLVSPQSCRRVTRCWAPQDPFYEAYIRPGEAPCQLADEDRLLFAVRSAAGVTRRTPDWLKATFMSNMEQQIAIETLAEENQVRSSAGMASRGRIEGCLKARAFPPPV